MTNKLRAFIQRNQIRNRKLYNTDLIEGLDYIVCPASQQRMIIIRRDYITNILGMTVEAYDIAYPDTQKRCQAHRDNIKQGIHRVDPKTGLTKYQLSQIKARAVLTQVDDTGMSGYKRKGQKTRATHMANIDEHDRNGYRQQADARLTTILPNGLTVEQHAHIKQRNTLIKNHCGGTGGASKISKKILAPILKYLAAADIKFYFDKFEYGIRDTDTQQYYFFDLTIPDYNIAIEYQSNAWHANPEWADIQWNQWTPPRGKQKTANESIAYDYRKAKSLYKHRGIVTHFVWEDSAATNIEDILCLLKTLHMKY